ncbi:substrate-binding domain-containing protein, partial [Nodularia harveyana UHCC-0300]
MWQKDKKDSAILSLALLLSLATTPMAAPLFVPTPVLAQSATEADSFPLPETVEDGTTVRIDGSISLAAINQSLKQSFEQQFSGTNVEVAANGSDVAISALVNGTVDLVAIARGLTAEEQAQGLLQVAFYREKIAIIVSNDNPFLGNLTDQQFADIFQGKITNWSEVGGDDVPIRFIDRPETSDTRNTFRTYPAFQDAEFTTGANATQVAVDDTAAIVEQLGNDGISYAMVHHVSQLPNVRVIPINETLPDNPNYEYSQPLVYAYRQNPSPNVISFLGFILGSPEQQAIETARTEAAIAIAENQAQPPVTPTPIAETAPVTPQPPDTPVIPDEIPLWWLLLPVAVVLILLIWVFRSRLQVEGENKTPNNPEASGEEKHDDSDQPLTEAALTAGTGSDMDSILAGEKVNDSDPKIASFETKESPWDIEAPASVVNVPYPKLSSKFVPEKPQEESDLAGEMEAAAASLWSDPDDDHNTPESSIAEESDLAGEMEAAAASLWSDPDDDHNTPESSIAEESDLAGEMEAA